MTRDYGAQVPSTPDSGNRKEPIARLVLKEALWRSLRQNTGPTTREPWMKRAESGEETAISKPRSCSESEAVQHGGYRVNVLCLTWGGLADDRKTVVVTTNCEGVSRGHSRPRKRRAGWKRRIQAPSALTAWTPAPGVADGRAASAPSSRTTSPPSIPTSPCFRP